MKAFRRILLAIVVFGSFVTVAENLSYRPWQTWYRAKKALVGAFFFAQQRQYLYENSLISSYASNSVPSSVRACPKESLQNRMVDGSCNSLQMPGMGAAGTRMGRNAPLKYQRIPDDKELLSPDPRRISRELFTRNEFLPIPYLNMLAASWIQFMVHDWFSHGDNQAPSSTKALLLELDETDPLRSQDQDYLVFMRSRYDHTRPYDLPKKNGNPTPTFLNEVTHWWDASQVYGSDAKTAQSLRIPNTGYMKINKNWRLPLGSDGVELVGFKRNWWLGLSLLHHVFILEHNAIVQKLQSEYPKMSSDELYNKARLVNAAIMAKIHTTEWSYAVSPNEAMKLTQDTNWSGLINPTKKRKVGFFNGQPGILDLFNRGTGMPGSWMSGIVGGETKLSGVPYAMTQEFVSAYRMHSLIPEELELRSLADRNSVEVVSVNSTRDAKSHQFTQEYSLKDLLYSFGTQHPGQVVLNNFPKFMQNIEIPAMNLLGLGTMDLAAMDIVRDRERGIPRYNDYRRSLGMPALKSFEDFIPMRDEMPPEMSDADFKKTFAQAEIMVAKLKDIYNNDIENLDSMVGFHAEIVRPFNFGFGETIQQVFILMASRRLHADRFFTEDYNAKTYTREGLKWIDQASLATVLLRHFPELEPRVRGLTSAFNTWNK
ncbi:peroxidase [bacterium]|nr:peroxidase [bacterium]